MSEPYTEILEDDDADAGIHVRALATSVATWSWMQQRETTVAEAALVFNTTPALIRRAVEKNYWSSIGAPDDDPSKQVIEHEGE